ncbi:hypothetical protein AVEN_255276-1 [Araneus ventricosus]|uniref:Uncharacterized protein n=1 Tax=Araneus ventricosus TaxID=182803 RepID=A0A4Y2BCY4_ARAVE|nr:hypothetical protein AVEN_255276-1 [Araneus ventricosus]
MSRFEATQELSRDGLRNFNRGQMTRTTPEPELSLRISIQHQQVAPRGMYNPNTLWLFARIRSETRVLLIQMQNCHPPFLQEKVNFPMYSPNNVPYSTEEEYYQQAVYVPYLDDFCNSLEERFESHKETVASLQHILPEFCTKTDFYSLEAAFNFYEEGLSHKEVGAK